MSITDTTLASLAASEQRPDAFLQRLRSNGPTSGDFRNVTSLLHRLIDHPKRVMTDRRRSAIHSLVGRVVRSPDTLLGHCFAKPRGYAGDFEIIDKIYTTHVAADTCAGNWDRYFHSLEAPKAVRNRKAYFKHWLMRQLERTDRTLHLLNLASGPARDLAEFLTEYPKLAERLEVDCVELDDAAIRHAFRLVGDRANVRFHRANVFRHRCKRDYDLIWSAGLFDYFEDAVFVRITRRYLRSLAPGGEFVVGNFDRSNPSLPQMILQDWLLHHRTATELATLARQAGATDGIRVDREAQGVNLFLHVRAPGS